FQAEDGIRDYKVTGVQTCALPIWTPFSGLGFLKTPRTERLPVAELTWLLRKLMTPLWGKPSSPCSPMNTGVSSSAPNDLIRPSRSEERRVGKECRSRRSRENECVW